MNPFTASKKILVMSSVLVRHPEEIRFAARWFCSHLPGHSPFTEKTPWITYRAIEWLDSHLGRDMSVFEFGAGGSTLFFSQRVRRVVSVEHDEKFHQVVARLLAESGIDNCELILRRPQPLTDGGPSWEFISHQAKYRGLSFEDYLKAIDEFPDASFDLVLVDGRARVESARRAFRKIKPGGYLMLDNSDRSGYAEVGRMLATCERQDMPGITPWNIEPSQTTVWRIPANGAI